MTIILVPAFFILAWIFFFTRQPNDGLRGTFLKTVLLFFAVVAGTTEILSLFYLITANGLIFVWLVANLALFVMIRRNIKTSVGKIWQDFREKNGAIPKLYSGFLILIYSITLILALFSPPNTSDSMTYHLARVANWIQFGTVEFYPTAIIRQLYQPPLAEYAVLQLQLLSGGDYFANLVQWLSLAAGGAVVSLIAKEFGGDLKMQTFAAVLLALLPTAIVQGSSTQNDLVVALFVAAFFFFWIRAVKSSAWADFVWTGLALGLAILTKGTAYVFCLPIGLFFIGVQFFALKKTARRLFVKQCAAVLLIAAALNAGHYARNYNLFGSPVSTAGDEVGNRNLTVKMFFSNAARNYTIHLGTYSEGLRTTLEGGLQTVFGDELKNPDSTWLKNEFTINYSTHEDLAGNLIHILLITFLLPFVFFIRTDEKIYIRAAFFSIVGGFILYSLLLKWQIYASRLQMPLFFLGCALAAVVIARILPRAAIPVLIMTFIFSLPPLFFAEPRGVFTDNLEFALTAQTREQRLFKNSPSAQKPYAGAANFIKQHAPESVGLMISANDFEYPLWLLLKDDFRQKPYIYHVGISNISSELAGARPLPDFIISTRNERIVEGVEYKEVWKNGNVRVLQKNASSE